MKKTAFVVLIFVGCATAPLATSNGAACRASCEALYQREMPNAGLRKPGDCWCGEYVHLSAVLQGAAATTTK